MNRWRQMAAGAGLLGMVGAVATVGLRPMSVVEAWLRTFLWAHGVRGGFVEVEGVRVFFLRAPARGAPGARQEAAVQTGAFGGALPPLVLVHGLGARSLDWGPLIPGLQAAGHEVIAIDLMGYGRSDKPTDAEYTIAEQAKTVSGVLRELGLARVDLAGWSMGGWIALKLAADEPERVRRLVLLDSAGMDFAMPYERSIFVPTNRVSLEALIGRLTTRRPKVPGFIARDLLRRMRAHAWVMERSVQAMLGGRDLMQFRLEEIVQPTMVIWGEEDRLIPIEAGERMAAGISGAVMVRLPGCGHLAPVECAKEVLPAMTRFLRVDDQAGWKR